MLVKFFKNKITAGIILVAFLTSGYFGYINFVREKDEIRYNLAVVEKGTIVVSVSGSGQILASDQIEIKPMVSGEVKEIFVEESQRVKKGDLLLKLDTKDYENAISEAQLTLDNARTALENLKDNKKRSQKDLEDYYDNAFNTISNTFNDLPQIINTLEPIFTESTYKGDKGDIDYYRRVVGLYIGQFFPDNEKESAFLNLKDKYHIIRNEYLLFLESSHWKNLENWLEKTSNLVKEISNLSRNGRDIISFYKETISKKNLTPPILLSITERQLTNLNEVTTFLDQKFSTISSLSKTIDQLNYSISDYDKQIDSQEKLIKQKKDGLEKAKENYENCFIRASLDGQIAKLNVKKGDTVSTVTPLLTLISFQKIAEISLNEIDVAKVKVGQKSTLNLDALPEVTITGKVAEIDTLGTISQGVVSYSVKIFLNTDNEAIKPGMSVTANIIVDAKSDILVVPNRAIKSQTSNNYVELVEIPEEEKKKFLDNRLGVTLSNPIKKQLVEIGISNDNLTEILSGLKEGDIVVSSTITPTTQTERNTQRFQIPGMGSSQMRFPR